MKLYFGIGVFIFTSLFSAKAQDQSEVKKDTLRTEGKEIRISSVIPEYVPRRALMYSAILPGLGQAYNKKYWKMPIVYGGFIGFGFMIHYYNEVHTLYKNQLINKLTIPGYQIPSGATEQQLRSIIERARRERDYMMVLTGAFYILQIADAHIDAHLREFDLNPGLQVKLKPTFQSIGMGNMVGLGLKFGF